MGPDAVPASAPEVTAIASARDDDLVVALSGVTFTYEGEAKPVLGDVSLTVTRGEFVLVMGPSGCGKSTLLHLLNGAIPHIVPGRLEGKAVICGRDVAATRVAEFATEVGMVFQDPDAQIVNTRVRDEVCFGLENLCRDRQEILTRQGQALDDAGLSGFAERSIFELSGGQKQRVSIAAALAVQPRLLVLDEPTANLDPAGMAEVFAVLARLNRDHGTTIVMVEHRVDELADKVSRVVMMEDGAVRFDGAPRAAFARRRLATAPAAGTAAASWFPQVCELAAGLAGAAQRDLAPAQVPLSVDEAVEMCLAWPLPAASSRGAAAAPGQPPHPANPPDPASPRPLLSIRSLTFGYHPAAPVLRSIDLELRSAAMVALLGQNGSGKTTLARLLVGINRPAAGTVWFEGRDLARLGPRDIASHVGYVFQNPDHQFVTDQVDEEIAYGLEVRGYAAHEIARRVDEVLEILDLARYRRRSPFSLSLGERRRLSVATMMVLEPRLLVLDEPTIGQDHERAQHLMALMVRLRQRYGTTILMITHDVRLVAQWAERALVMRSGGIVFDGPPLALFDRAEVVRAAGLLPPPIHEVSRRLAARVPGRGLAPVLSPQALVAALACGGQQAAGREALP